MDVLTSRLSQILEAMKEGDSSSIPYYVAILVLLKRSYYYRYLKRGVLPAGLLALTYRFVQGSNNDLLSLISKWVASNGSRVRGLSGDICGALVLGGVVNFSEEIISLFRVLLRPNLKKTLINALFEIIKPLPPVQKQIKEEFAKKTQEFEHSFKAKSREYNLKYGPSNTALPIKGKPEEEILAMMNELCLMEDTKWQAGKVTGSVYHGSKVRTLLRSYLNVTNQQYSFIYVCAPAMYRPTKPS